MQVYILNIITWPQEFLPSPKLINVLANVKAQRVMVVVSSDENFHRPASEAAGSITDS